MLHLCYDHQNVLQIPNCAPIDLSNQNVLQIHNSRQLKIYIYIANNAIMLHGVLEVSMYSHSNTLVYIMQCKFRVLHEM